MSVILGNRLGDFTLPPLHCHCQVGKAKCTFPIMGAAAFLFLPQLKLPKEMMVSKYYGVPEHEIDSVGGSKYGFRNVEQNSRI